MRNRTSVGQFRRCTGRYRGRRHPEPGVAGPSTGAYDPDTGLYTDETGRQKFYFASDNLVEENWTGLPEGEVIAVLARAGLTFDAESRTGVVPHMLSCLALDGRFGLTAVGDSPEQAEDLHLATVTAMQDLAARYE